MKTDPHRIREGRSIDGLCVFPNCDRTISDLVNLPICNGCCIKVYKAAQHLIGAHAGDLNA